MKKILGTIRNRIASIGETQNNLMSIDNQYCDFDSPCDFNGNQVLDLNKLGTVMSFFAQYCNKLYKVKLMKMLWYADALSFKRKGKAMTGLVYKHQNFGALCIANNQIINIGYLNVQEIEKDDGTIYLLTPKQGYSLETLTSDEIDILYEVVKKFMDMKTSEIVEYMHQEVAYKETLANQIIPFSLCSQLNPF